jgi:hypothetical protein
MPPRSFLPTLAALSDDLRRVRSNLFMWDDIVRARRTLPSGEPVEAWYLAGLFLRTWANEIARAERRRVMAEGLRPTAIDGEYEPTASRRQVDSLADEIIQDANLDPYLSQHLEVLANSLISAMPDSGYGGGLVHAAVEAHEWCVLLAVLTHYQRLRTLSAVPGALRGFRSSLRNLSRSIQEFASSLSETQRAYAAELMTNYRNSTLAFSWMPYCNGDPDSDIEDPLFPTKREMAVIHDLAKQIARDFEGAEGLSVSVVRSVVERLAEAILERGYADFARDIASPGYFADQQLGEMGQHINVIPGDNPARCAPLLVAIATAGRKTSLTTLLPKVRKHLIDCDRITKGVIVVTDEWKPGILGDSLGDLKSHVAKGKKIVFLLAPQPGKSIVHMPISLF